jgi:hypothetical protein
MLSRSTQSVEAEGCRPGIFCSATCHFLFGHVAFFVPLLLDAAPRTKPFRPLTTAPYLYPLSGQFGAVHVSLCHCAGSQSHPAPQPLCSACGPLCPSLEGDALL